MTTRRQFMQSPVLANREATSGLSVTQLEPGLGVAGVPELSAGSLTYKFHKRAGTLAQGTDRRAHQPKRRK
jgi:hypothetical protein